MILWYAQNQHADGAIPASPYDGGSVVLFDYNAYWVEDLYDYVLYTGDLALAQAGLAEPRRADEHLVPGPARPRRAARQQRSARRLRLHPAHGHDRRLLQRGLRPGAALRRPDRRLDRPAGRGRRLDGRGSRRSRRPSGRVLGRLGRGLPGRDDRPGRPPRGRQRLRDPRRARDARAGALGARLPRLATTGSPTGRRSPTTTSGTATPGATRPTMRVYPFIGLLRRPRALPVGPRRLGARADPARVGLHARERAEVDDVGDDRRRAAALRSTPTPPTTTAGRAARRRRSRTTRSACMPATPGFGSYVAEPHPADLRWARGTIPTPHGAISFRWAYTRRRDERDGRRARARQDHPARRRAARLDGRPIPRQRGLYTTVRVAAGSHTLVVATRG